MKWNISVTKGKENNDDFVSSGVAKTEKVIIIMKKEKKNVDNDVRGIEVIMKKEYNGTREILFE